MTDANLPAVPTEREIARADTDSWVAVIAEVAKFAAYVADTEFVPKSLRGNPAAVTAAIVYGRETGLGPMASLTQTYVVNGTPSLSAKGKRGLVLAAGHEIETLESTGAICRMRSRRRGSERWSSEVVWTIDMARAAGLLGKDNWKAHPRQMLTARCSGELCDRDFPDVVLGFATAEDMIDEDGAATFPQAAQGSTKVTRKRAAAKQALPAAPPPAEQPQAPAGPPLPGEDGFEDLAPTGAPETSAGESVGEAPDSPADPETEGAGEGQPDAAEAPVTGSAESAPEDPAPSDDPPAEEEARVVELAPGSGRKPSRPQMRMLMASLNERGIDPEDREERLLVASKIVGRAISSFDELDGRDASRLIDTLARTKNRDELWELLDAIDEAAAQDGADQ